VNSVAVGPGALWARRVNRRGAGHPAPMAIMSETVENHIHVALSRARRGLLASRRAFRGLRTEDGWSRRAEPLPGCESARRLLSSLLSGDRADRLYVSTFTVGSHLRHIYQKLGINSRLQLADETRRHHPNDIA
jgi:Bacterial regulatory proteins, luxR family